MSQAPRRRDGRHGKEGQKKGMLKSAPWAQACQGRKKGPLIRGGVAKRRGSVNEKTLLSKLEGQLPSSGQTLFTGNAGQNSPFWGGGFTETGRSPSVKFARKGKR